MVHRDIKPENILLHDGRALVADFGIALAASKAGGNRMTETGMSLGTPHYMSPEQAMGERDITARSDIYALGCVLYEMLAGEPPFTGATAQAIVARVLTESPRSLRPQRKSIPPQVEAAVMTALEKLPADRFESAKAFAEALVDPGYSGGLTGARTVLSRAAPGAGMSVRRLLVPAVAIGLACAVLGLAAGWIAWHPRQPDFPPVGPAVLRRPARQCRADRRPRDADGLRARRLGLRLYLAGRPDAARTRTGSKSAPVAGGRRGLTPFFSPDGRWLGFGDGPALIKVPLAGGAPVTICDSCAGYSFSWGSDDTIRYHTAPPDNGGTRVLMAVSAQGGRPHEFARPDSASGEAFRTPILLPGRRTVLFTIYKGSAGSLAAVDLAPARSPDWISRDSGRSGWLPASWPWATRTAA